MRPSIPRAGRCLICRKPLGGEPHWITSLPDGEHVRCRDYRDRAFVYERELAWFLARQRSLRGLLADITSFARWLGTRKAIWPGRRRETVAQVRARLIRLRRRWRDRGL